MNEKLHNGLWNKNITSNDENGSNDLKSLLPRWYKIITNKEHI